MPDAPTGGLQIVVADDAEHLAHEASSLILTRLTAALESRGKASVILAGGSTPRPTHALLASGIRNAGLAVGSVSWFFGDERWVAVGDPQSNEGMARETLLGPLDAAEQSINSWHAGSGDPVDCARRYAALVRAGMGTPRTAPDVLILGMGADGHTASLFPDASVRLYDGREIPVSRSLPVEAAAVMAGPTRGWRLTLCPDFLKTSRTVIFLVAGADKAPALQRAREEDPRTPASWIRGSDTFFIATRDAFGPETPAYGPALRHA
jgi:6-phosphogluconolactonase